MSKRRISHSAHQKSQREELATELTESTERIQCQVYMSSAFSAASVAKIFHLRFAIDKGAHHLSRGGV